MRIEIRDIDFKLSNSQRDYITNSFKKISNHTFRGQLKDEIFISISINKYKDQTFELKAIVQILKPHEKKLIATAKGTSINAIADDSRKKILSQLRQIKAELEHRRKNNNYDYNLDDDNEVED